VKRHSNIVIVIAWTEATQQSRSEQRPDSRFVCGRDRAVVSLPRVLGRRGEGLGGVYEAVRGIRDGGGNGSIIGRNTFQRPKEQAMEMRDKIINIDKNGD